MAVLLAVAAATATVTLPRSSSPTPCPDAAVVTTVGGVTLCTHGPEAEGPATGSPESAANRSIRCSGNGTSGARVKAVYARPADRADRYSSLLSAMAAAAGEVEHIVDRSASQTGGGRHVRWATAAARAPATGCSLSVARVTVPATAATDFAALIGSLDDQGLNRHDRKYLVWVDSAGSTCSGIGTHLSDDRPGQENYNNTSVGYARIADDCLAETVAGRVETHELLHLLGAVQGSAPNVSPRGHCRDEWDLLCYDDDGGAGPFRTIVRCPTTANDRRLDCNHDDYFSTAPPAGSYLATHWNAADSRYLDREAPVLVPGPVADPPPNDAFADIPVGARYENAVSWALVAGVMTGYPDGTWRPRKTVSRGQGVTILWHLMDEPVATGSHPFANVPAGAPYRAALDWAVENGLVAGAPGDAFAPRDPMTRAQLVDLLWVLAGRPTSATTPTFTDVPGDAAYADALQWAVGRHLVSGDTDGTFRPGSAVTRAQLAMTLFALAGDPGSWTSAPTDPPSTVVF